MWTVVSDLHLFSHRSRAHLHLDSIIETARQSDRLILNGDIFDFHWSSLGELTSTLGEAESWLRDLAHACPDTRIHYLLGNHDAVRPWAECCAHLSNDVSNLSWSPDYLRMGDTLFTHGDLLLGAAPRTTRTLEEDVRSRRPSTGRAYSLLSILRIPFALTLCIPHRLQARVIHRNFLRLGDQLTRGVRRLCVGHTHRPFSGLCLDGLEIHNTGSTIAGMPFRPVTLLPDDGEGVLE